ncbi:unnamed protein product [Pylaiella littoralis]
MTSLDFQSLLKQEKARQRAEFVQQNQTAVQPHHDSVAANLRRDAEARVPPDGGLGRTQPSPPCFVDLVERLPLDMEKMRVGDTPSIFYVPDFISEAEEQEIRTRTYARDVDADASDEWVSLRSRRLKCWGGQPGESFRPEPLPPWVGALCDLLVVRKVFAEEDRPNHVLLNEYQPGQGIMAHTDGPFYRPRTATLSLGSDAIMHFSPRLAAADVGRPGVQSQPQASLVLRPRCLVVFADDAYSRQLHGIDAVREETVGSATGGDGSSGDTSGEDGLSGGGGGRTPVINAEAAGAPEGTVLRRKLRVSLTFRRVCADADCGRDVDAVSELRDGDQRET